MAGLFERAHTLQAIDALEESERGGLFSFVSPRITSPDKLDDHLAKYNDLRAATVLFLGQGAVVGATELHIGDDRQAATLPAISKTLYADTVGRAQASIRSIVPIEASSEAYGDFRTFLRYASAAPVEAAGRQLLAAHLIQASSTGELSDVLMYPEEVGEQLDQHFEQAVDALNSTLPPDKREIASLTLGYELETQSRVPLLVATIMPTPGEMGDLVNAYYG